MNRYARWIPVCLLSAFAACTTVLPIGYDGFTLQAPQHDVTACRLLNAASDAYQVGQPGPLTDTNFAPELGQRLEAYGVVNEEPKDQDEIGRDSAYVWRSANEVIIAFRGTLPFKNNSGGPSLQLIAADWLNDANFDPQSDPDLGPVHRGFRDSFDNLWNDSPRGKGIATYIKQWHAAGELGPGVTIYITGHSKGGPLARMAALKLGTLYPDLLPQMRVATFAAARAGGQVFAGKYAALAIKDSRYENQYDVVPHLPLDKQELSSLGVLTQVVVLDKPQLGDFASVGELHYIINDPVHAGSLDIITPGNDEAKLNQIRLDNFRVQVAAHAGDIKTITGMVIDAHGLDTPGPSDPSRYYQAVCGGS
jgi:hypothetical protein